MLRQRISAREALCWEPGESAEALRHPSFKSVASRLRRLAQIRFKKGEDDEAAEKVTADHIRRSDRGRQAIRRVVVKACELDAVSFRTNPSFDHISQKANVKGAPGYEYTDFVAHVPFYYQYLYHECRNPEKYGAAVHKDLSSMISELRQDPPCRKKFQNMIAECRSAKLSGSIEVWYLAGFKTKRLANSILGVKKDEKHLLLTSFLMIFVDTLTWFEFRDVNTRYPIFGWISVVSLLLIPFVLNPIL